MLADRSLTSLSSEWFYPAADSDAETHSHALHRAYGFLWKSWGKNGGPQEEGNSTKRPTELTNLNPWGSQSQNHKPKSVHGLDLGPDTYVADVQFGFHGVLNNKRRICL